MKGEKSYQAPKPVWVMGANPLRTSMVGEEHTSARFETARARHESSAVGALEVHHQVVREGIAAILSGTPLRGELVRKCGLGISPPNPGSTWTHTYSAQKAHDVLRHITALNLKGQEMFSNVTAR